MIFYKSIAKYYQYIFPLNREQVNFIKERQCDSNSKILDIGCAVGDLSIALSDVYEKVVAIDLDSEMINLARENSKHINNIGFDVVNMLDVSNIFEQNSFDSAICLGNTLVHLDSQDAICQLFKSIRYILKSKGKFIFQIINYDRIFDGNLKKLPTIENETVKFERNYLYSPTDSNIIFSTILTIKSTNKKLYNKVPLLPVRKDEIERLLLEAGFKSIVFYGNFRGDPFTKNSMPLVVESW